MPTPNSHGGWDSNFDVGGKGYSTYFEAAEAETRFSGIRDQRTPVPSNEESSPVGFLLLIVGLVFFFLLPVGISSILWQKTFLEKRIIRNITRVNHFVTGGGLLLVGSITFYFVKNGNLVIHPLTFPTSVYIGSLVDLLLVLLLLLGLLYLVAGLVTYPFALLNAFISTRNPQRLDTDGFAWLSLVCLLSNSQPKRYWTFVQDTLLAALAAFLLLNGLWYVAVFIGDMVISAWVMQRQVAAGQYRLPISTGINWRACLPVVIAGVVILSCGLLGPKILGEAPQLAPTYRGTIQQTSGKQHNKKATFVLSAIKEDRSNLFFGPNLSGQATFTPALAPSGPFTGNIDNYGVIQFTIGDFVFNAKVTNSVKSVSGTYVEEVKNPQTGVVSDAASGTWQLSATS